MNISFTQSRDVFEYGKLVKPLLDDFGSPFCQTIMEWCNVVPDEFDNYWEWYLIYDDSKVIGCCGLYSLDENTEELWLSWFGILPEYRSKGVGTIALEFLYGIAKTVKCKILRSYVDKEGKPLVFYGRNGFKVIGTVQEFLDNNKLKEIDGDQFEDMNDIVIEKQL